ncbi:MAG: hypothetical protein WD379_04995 [Dehalococcoidia bacterium]
MGRGQFEEIFEECLSALLEGRRSIEDSLSLYPAWRGRLEPLLRSAQELAAAHDQSPPPYARERGLQRFLEAARLRRRLRQIFPARPEGFGRWAPVGALAAVAVMALAFVSATLMSESGEALNTTTGQASVRPYVSRAAPGSEVAAEPTPLDRVRDQVAALEATVRRGQSVDTATLWELEEASSDLAAELHSPDKIELLQRVAVVSAASQEYDLLSELKGTPQGFSPLALEASLAAAGDVLGKLGATPEPDPEPSPAATPDPSPAAIPSPPATPQAPP